LTIKIGELEFDTPVMLAPMAGVTDAPFRHMVRKYGASLLFSEMIASQIEMDKEKKDKRHSNIDFKGEFPLAVQILGFDADMIAETVKIMTDKGAALIDLNFGCPAKKIVNKVCGSALMRDEKIAADILEKAVKSTHLPVTLKMRLGWDDEHKNALNIAKIAEASGIKMLTIHGRTRSQLFSGNADWSALKEIKENVNLPLIVNGDIKSPEDAEAALKQSKADGVMIGRGACGKPWLLKQVIEYIDNKNIIQTPSPNEIKDDMLEHYNLIIKQYGDYTGLGIGRKHMGWYLDNLHNSSITKAAINTENSYMKVIEIINSYFDNNF